MKRCLSCDRTFPFPERPFCGWAPVTIDGRPWYAPETGEAEGGYSASRYEKLEVSEGRHFWFRARSALILWALHRHFPRLQSFLDLGCGTGAILHDIRAEWPNVRLAGSEMLRAGLDRVARRLPDVEVMQMDARALPFADEFDVIGAFDVVEHIQEDDVVFENLFRAVRPGGGVILTVPQHAWLWSDTDDMAGHVRRYTRREICGRLEAAGFAILRSTSFVSLLLPMLIASRLFRKASGERDTRPGQELGDLEHELNIPTVVNRLLLAVMRLEQLLIRAGLSLPAGGSLLVVAQRPRPSEDGD